MSGLLDAQIDIFDLAHSQELDGSGDRLRCLRQSESSPDAIASYYLYLRHVDFMDLQDVELVRSDLAAVDECCSTRWLL